MKVRLIPLSCLALCLFGIWSTNVQAKSLCKQDERIVFSCVAKKKLVSLCTIGNLKESDGRLIYRFGKILSQVELEFGYDAPPQSLFTYDEESWAKGESITIGFKHDGTTYAVNHAAGAFGVEGGPNVASVSLYHDDKRIGDLACNEPSVVDRMYEC